MDPITQKLLMASAAVPTFPSVMVEDVFGVDVYRGFGSGHDSPFASAFNTNYGVDGYYSTYFAGLSGSTPGIVDANAQGTWALNGNFTVEMWVKGSAQAGQGSPSYNRLWQLDGPSGNSDNRNLQMTINPSDQTLHTWCTGSGSGSNIALVGSVNIMDGNWHHVCVERATIGGTTDIITQYVDGVPDGATSQDQNLFNPNSSEPRMRWGAYDGSNGHYKGYISNFRITVGAAMYVSNQPSGTTFTPSTSPLTGGTMRCFQDSEVYMHSMPASSNLTLTPAGPGVTPKTGRRICENLDFTEGGLLWIKNLSAAQKHRLYDTERGQRKVITSQAMDEEGAAVDGGIEHFTNKGASHVRAGDSYFAVVSQENEPNNSYVGWGFRKAKRFFDVIKYTGNNVNGRTIEHNLKCEPGVIMIKCLTATYGWQVYHRSLSTTGSNGQNATSWLRLDTADFASTANTPGFNNINRDTFDIGSYVAVNGTGQSYVAYVFAHDDDPADRGIIKCGSYTGNSGVNRVELGWEPQYLMIKRSDAGSENWWIYDSQRDGLRAYNNGSMNEANGSVGSIIYANEPNSTDQTFDILADATGFNLPAVGGGNNANSDTFVYIAIRRGPMGTPTDPTTVFNVSKGKAVNIPTFPAKFPADVTWAKHVDTNMSWRMNIRKQGIINTQNSSRFDWDTSANPSGEADYKGEQMKGAWATSAVGNDYIGYVMRRAPKFLDVVGYAGNASGENPNIERAIKHGLGVKPELLILRGTGWSDPYGNAFFNAVKNCGNLPDTASGPYPGVAYPSYKNLGTPGSGGASTWGNSPSHFGTSTDTATEFYVGTHNYTNRSLRSYVALLWATCPGVSKVGYYVGTGSDLDVPCGFTGDARLVMINKWNEMTWYVYDSVSGITSSNEDYLRWDTTDPKVSGTDYIDPYTSGFKVTSSANTTINVSGHYYTFLAIA